MTSKNFIIKTEIGGIKILTINDLKSKKFSLNYLYGALEYDVADTT